MRWLKKDIVGFGLASFFNDFCHEMSTAILPAFVTQLVGIQHAPSVLGMINGISNAISSIIRLWTGWLSDIVSRVKPLLVIGYALTPIFIGLMGFAQQAWQVVMCRSFAWVGRGLREPPRDALLSEIVSYKDYGKAFGFQRACDSLGAIAGPMAAFFALKYLSLRSIFFISFIPGIFSVFAIIFFVKDRVKSTSFYHVSFFEQFKLLPSSFKYFVLIRLLFGMGNFNVTLIILRALEIFSGQVSSSIIATGWAIALYVMFNFMRSLSEYSIGTLSDHVNRKYLLVGAFGLFSIVCLNLLQNPQTMGWWSIIFILTGISVATVTVIERAYAADLLPNQMRGTGYGLLQAIKGFGELFSGLLIGSLWSYISPWAAFSCAAFLTAGATFLLMLLPTTRRRREQQASF